MSHLIGTVAENRLADLVIWEPEFFGAKPHTILKGGQIAYSQVNLLWLMVLILNQSRPFFFWGASIEDGDAECIHPDSRAGHPAANVRRFRQSRWKHVGGFRVPGQYSLAIFFNFMLIVLC